MDSTNIKTSSQTSPLTNGPSKSGQLALEVPESVIECHLQLLESKEFADVTFVLGKRKQSIECHQLFLKARSNVFKTMFKERWNNNPNQLRSIEIPDIEPETFEHLLQFVYADLFKIETIQEAIELLCLAHMYEVKGLVKRCEALLKALITVEEAVNIWEVACHFNLKDLQNDASQVMATHFQSLTQHSSFLEADERTLEALLHRNDIMSKEINIFNALVRWARNKISPQQQPTDELRLERPKLENLLRLIKYSLMSVDQFYNFVVPTKIALHDDIIDMRKYFGGGESESSDLQKCNFPLTSDGVSISMDLYEPLTLAEYAYAFVHSTTNHEETLMFACIKAIPRSGFKMNSLVLRGPSNKFEAGYTYTKSTLPPKVEATSHVTVSVRTSSANNWTTSGDSITVAKNIAISNTRDTVINIIKPIVLKHYVWITTTFHSTVSVAHVHPDLQGSSRISINDFVQLNSEQQNEMMLKIQEITLVPSTGGSGKTSMFTHNNIPYKGYSHTSSQCSLSCLAHVVRSIGMIRT